MISLVPRPEEAEETRLGSDLLYTATANLVICHGNQKGPGFFRFPVPPEGSRRRWMADVKIKGYVNE